MGIVYKAEDMRLHRFVALKILPEQVASDPQFVDRFAREAQAASALNHPHICTIHDVGYADDRYYIAMELMEGRALKDVIADSRLSIEQVLEWGSQIADGLDASHLKGIIHRDLKPGNLFITSREQAKILDFGLAKIIQQPACETGTPQATLLTDITAPGSVFGTIEYMSPEQIRGETIDTRTDLFSLGVVLYEMTTGARPFVGLTAGAITDSILHNTPALPTRLNPATPPKLEKIIIKALEKDRRIRYQHASEMRVGLGRANGFVWKQFVICTNAYSAPLWIAGLLCFLRNPRYRPFAWMYLIPLVFFYVAKGVSYYLAPAYPMLIAMGSAAGEYWVGRLPRLWRRAAEAVLFTGIAGAGVYGCALVLPLASRGPLMHFALQNNGALREELGWNDLVQTVAGIRDSLPLEQRQDMGVVVGNYGEQGAVEILGSAYRLPRPISMTNSAWLRGYPLPPPSTLIVLGFSRESAERAFTSCRLAGHNGNSYGVKNEESEEHPDIFVCGGPRQSWPEFWKEYQAFG